MSIEDKSVSELRIAEGNKTLEETIACLNKNKRCLVVRPTGFGKSHMLAHLTRRYNKSLYIYPIDIIKQSMLKGYKDVLKDSSFMSYRAMLELFKRGELEEYLIGNQFDLLMFDEVHHIGAKNFRDTYSILEKVISNGAHMIGVTATPDRMDEFDYATILFKNKRVYKYTLHDCIQAGLMLKPYYVHSLFDIAEAKVSHAIDKIKSTRNVPGLTKSMENKLRQAEIEVANLLNASSIIKKHIDILFNNNVDYLKFIVFFPSIQILHDKMDDVVVWFSKAYPNMSINKLIISSETEYRKNLKLIDNMRPVNGNIDLIMCIDMLNMGYHIDTLTGIVMVRGTRSSIVYWQQIGRCMSVTAKRNPIIFDFVCNYKVNPFFEKQSKKGRDSSGEREDYAFGLTVQDLIIDDSVASYEMILKELDKIQLRSKEKEIIFMYTSRKMPLYVLSERYGATRAEIKKLLERNRVTIEDESVLNNIVDGRKLYMK